MEPQIFQPLPSSRGKPLIGLSIVDQANASKTRLCARQSIRAGVSVTSHIAGRESNRSTEDDAVVISPVGLQGAPVGYPHRTHPEPHQFTSFRRYHNTRTVLTILTIRVGGLLQAPGVLHRPSNTLVTRLSTTLFASNGLMRCQQKLFAFGNDSLSCCATWAYHAYHHANR